MKNNLTRREALKSVGCLAGTGLLVITPGCEKQPAAPEAAPAMAPVAGRDHANEEYVWLSANANLPLFVAHDHPALRRAGQELGVKVTIAGPNSVDVPGLVAAIEQTTARRPAGMMVVGWDPSSLVPPINEAIEAGIPVVCVD